MKTMNEKVTMVTGAAAGIGLACAEAFAKAGATVVLVDINEPKEQAEKLKLEGYKAVSYRCDVSGHAGGERDGGLDRSDLRTTGCSFEQCRDTDPATTDGRDYR